MLLEGYSTPVELPLRGLLRARGVPQWKVARALEVPESTLNRVLRGIVEASPELGKKLHELETELQTPPPAQTIYRRNRP